MAKAKAKPKPSVMKPALPEGVEMITIEVPYFTGEMDVDVNSRDVNIQAMITDPAQREGWTRFNHAMKLLHEQAVGETILEHFQHHRAKSIRWLIAQLKG